MSVTAFERLRREQKAKEELEQEKLKNTRKARDKKDPEIDKRIKAIKE